MDLKFEWDEAKRLSNIAKHGIDFLDADLLFERPRLEAAAKVVKGEQRWLTTGIIYDLAVTAVFTRRDDTIRLISLRRADNAERRRYNEAFKC